MTVTWQLDYCEASLADDEVQPPRRKYAGQGGDNNTASNGVVARSEGAPGRSSSGRFSSLAGVMGGSVEAPLGWSTESLALHS